MAYEPKYLNSGSSVANHRAFVQQKEFYKPLSDQLAENNRIAKANVLTSATLGITALAKLSGIEKGISDNTSAVNSNTEAVMATGMAVQSLENTLQKGTQEILASQEQLARTIGQGFSEVSDVMKEGFNSLTISLSSLEQQLIALNEKQDIVIEKLDQIHDVVNNPEATRSRELYRRGIKRLSKGLLEEALEDFNSAIEHDLTDSASWFFSGKLHFLYPGPEGELFDIDRAYECFSKADKYAAADFDGSDEMRSYICEIKFYLTKVAFLKFLDNHADVTENDLVGLFSILKSFVRSSDQIAEYHISYALFLISKGDSAKASENLVASIINHPVNAYRLLVHPDLQDAQIDLNAIINQAHSGLIQAKLDQCNLGLLDYGDRDEYVNRALLFKKAWELGMASSSVGYTPLTDEIKSRGVSKAEEVIFWKDLPVALFDHDKKHENPEAAAILKEFEPLHEEFFVVPPSIEKDTSKKERLAFNDESLSPSRTLSKVASIRNAQRRATKEYLSNNNKNVYFFDFLNQRFSKLQEAIDSYKNLVEKLQSSTMTIFDLADFESTNNQLIETIHRYSDAVVEKSKFESFFATAESALQNKESTDDGYKQWHKELEQLPKPAFFIGLVISLAYYFLLPFPGQGLNPGFFTWFLLSLPVPVVVAASIVRGISKKRLDSIISSSGVEMNPVSLFSWKVVGYSLIFMILSVGAFLLSGIVSYMFDTNASGFFAVVLSFFNAAFMAPLFVEWFVPENERFHAALRSK